MKQWRAQTVKPDVNGFTIPIADVQALLKGFLCPDNNHSGKNLDTNMKIKLSMGEGDMPGGIIKLLSMINHIHPLHQTNHEQDR